MKKEQKKSFKKVLSGVLAVLLLSAGVFALGACNQKKGEKTQDGVDLVIK